MRLPDGSVGLGDVIVQLDDAPIESDRDLLRSLDQKKPGDTVRLTVVRLTEQRNGELLTRKVELSIKLQAAEVA